MPAGSHVLGKPRLGDDLDSADWRHTAPGGFCPNEDSCDRIDLEVPMMNDLPSRDAVRNQQTGLNGRQG
jgi:hypothetical protein